MKVRKASRIDASVNYDQLKDGDVWRFPGQESVYYMKTDKGDLVFDRGEVLDAEDEDSRVVRVECELVIK